MSMSQAAIAAVMEHGPEEFKMAVRWQYYRPRDRSEWGFFDYLFEAAAHADAENLTRIQLGFPSVAYAVYKWKNIPGWAQEVERWGEERAAQEAERG